MMPAKAGSVPALDALREQERLWQQQLQVQQAQMQAAMAQYQAQAVQGQRQLLELQSETSPGEPVLEGVTSRVSRCVRIPAPQETRRSTRRLHVAAVPKKKAASKKKATTARRLPKPPAVADAV